MLTNSPSYLSCSGKILLASEWYETQQREQQEHCSSKYKFSGLVRGLQHYWKCHCGQPMYRGLATPGSKGTQLFKSQMIHKEGGLHNPFPHSVLARHLRFKRICFLFDFEPVQRRSVVRREGVAVASWGSVRQRASWADPECRLRKQRLVRNQNGLNRVNLIWERYIVICGAVFKWIISGCAGCAN